MRPKNIFSALMLVCCAVFATQALFAQQASRYVYVLVDSVYHHNDSLLLRLNCGGNIGLAQGKTGSVIARYLKDFEDANYDELGFGHVISTSKSKAVFYVSKPATKDRRDIYKLDMVKFAMKPPTAGELFTELAARSIIMSDQYKDPLYSLAEIWQRGEAFNSDSLLDMMIADVKSTAESLHPDSAKFSVLFEPIKNGRYKGLGVIHVMDSISRKDVMAFLYFVLSYPGKYMGYTYKFNETFATWVLNEGLYSARELMANYNEVKTDSVKLKKWLAENAALLRKEKLTGSMYDEAVTYGNEDQHELEMESIKEGLYIAYAINDTLGKAALYQAKAQTYQDKEQYSEAVILTDSTIKYASMANDGSYLFAGYFKKAYCLYKKSAYPEAHAVLREAESMLKNYHGKIEKVDSLDNWRKRYEYAGWIDYASGNYNTALQYLYKSILFNNTVQTGSSIDNNASDYYFIGNIYRKQGYYEKSLKALDSSGYFYKLLGSTYWAAYTQNEIGRTYYDWSKYKQSIAYHDSAYKTLIDLEKWDNAGYAKSMLGSNLEMIEKIPEAIDAHKEAIGLRRKANNKEGQAWSWKKLGKLYERTGQKIDALNAYDSSAFYYAAIGDSSEQAQMLLSLGKVYANDKDNQKARLYYEKAAFLLKRLSSRSGYIDALDKLGTVTFADDVEASIDYYTECLNESRAVSDQVDELYSMINLGALAGKQYKMDSSNAWFTKALPLAISTKDKRMEAYCYRRMGGVAELRLQRNDAFDYYRKAADIYKTVDIAEYFNMQNTIGNLYVSTGQFDSASIVNTKTAIDAGKQGYKLQQGDALIAQSFLYNLQAKYKEGMALADSAQRVFAKSGNAISQANVLATKALQYKGMGNYEAAIRHFNMADSIYLQEKDTWSRATIANNTGTAYFHMGNYRKAIELFNQSLSLTPLKGDHENNLRSKANIAECYTYLKAYDTALNILEPLYNVAKQQKFDRMSSSVAILLGRIYYAQQKFDKALPLVEEAMHGAEKAGIPSEQTESYMYMGMLTKQKDPKQALTYLQKATSIADKFKVESTSWEAYYELGEYYYETKNFPAAIAAYKKSVKIVDSSSVNIVGGEDAIKMYQSAGKKPELYKRLISALATTGATDEAWAFAQKTQQEAVKDLMGKIDVNSGDANKKMALQKLAELQQQRAGLDQSLSTLRKDTASIAQLKSLQKTRDVLEKEYLNYVTDLVKTYPDIDGYFSRNVNPEDFKNNKDMIPDSTAVVLYVINGRQLLIFTATNQKVGVKEETLDADLEPLVDQYIAYLSNPAKYTGTGALRLRSTIKKSFSPPKTNISFKDMSDMLYQMLIKPVEEDIKGAHSLCIIPNGKLSNLPFQCIGRKTNDSTLHYLVEDYSIFYTNKLEIFSRPARKDKGLNSFTAFGNPDNSLESAGDEVKAIGNILHAPDIFLQGQATESRAKSSLEKNRYVHFATHGVLNYTDFSGSYLKMANVPDGNEDGELRIDEIKSIDISGCDLVTLSACETAVNQELKKGWYISPANAFLVNRVRSVVASLWAVDDQATNLLMQEFYKNLQSMTKEDALRKAQATLSAKPGFEHPFYWGAFVLYGDWR